MKIAIMQPYLFPYIGYWQLINMVDEFILLDDVSFITRGYINRNSILLNGKDYLFSIPLNKPSQNKLIKDTQLKFFDKDKINFLKTINMPYKKAPYFHNAYPVIEKCILNDEINLSKYIDFSIKQICDYLSINTKISKSSNILKEESLKAQDRIIYINQVKKSTIYINPIGGLELYNKEDFLNNNIKLYFFEN
ncbi:WbqC family protein [Campylobacter sp. P0109]|uniref:WbqC family protein n=1 Tax=Campylobacter sp. P0109 TaxID=1895606 RepID=UPI00191C8416|nr:WbqC family protein [Campylobacter sp. P0109]